MKTLKRFDYLLQIVGVLSLMTLIAISMPLATVSAMEPASTDPTLVVQNEISTLTKAEVQDMLFMREEEKLARDVYLTLYQTWGLPIFQNIANSEATHMEAIKNLINQYGLVDPVSDNTIGVFNDETLQALYNQLIAEGSQSVADALRVGAAIEEIDILDLEEAIAHTDKADIQLVYENLMKGSRNHLRSFTSTLQQQTGQIYAPQYLDAATYQEIVDTAQETGKTGQGRSGKNQSSQPGQRSRR